MGRRSACYRDNQLLNALCGLAVDHLEGIFADLGVRMPRFGDVYRGRCPVHGGRSTENAIVYLGGRKAPGSWKCYSKHCEGVFRPSLLGLIMGILSHRENGWVEEGDEKVARSDAVDYLTGFLGVKLDRLRVDREAGLLHELGRDVDFVATDLVGAHEVYCGGQHHRDRCRIPAPYYLRRGYGEQVLRKFEVGQARRRDDPMAGRVLVPVYDPTGRAIIGMLSRANREACDDCGLCHGECLACDAAQADRKRYLRWSVEGRFKSKHHLYNLWRAKGPINKSRCVVLVEGAGDVWRLDEAGIRNSVATFGAQLTAQQDIILQTLDIANLIVLTDDDDAGDRMHEEVRKSFGSLLKVHRVRPIGAKDVGAMATELVRFKIGPLVAARMR